MNTFLSYFFNLVQSVVDGDLLDQLCSSEEIWTDMQFPDLPVPEGREGERGQQ